MISIGHYEKTGMKDYEQTRHQNISYQYRSYPKRDEFLDPDNTISKWVEERQRYRNPPGDHLRDGFAPAGMTTTDFTIIRHEGLFHFFACAGFPECFPNWPGQYEYVFHATTADLISWTVHGIALQPHPDNEFERGKIWPPFVFRHGDVFAMIYCGLDANNCQCLCLATSDDLFQWTRFPRNPIVNPGEHEWTLKRPDGKVRHCRDPHVEKIGDTYYLYYATVCEDGNPAVGLSATEDLNHWHDLGPCFKRTEGWVPESPLVICRSDRYYLWIYPFDELLISDNPTDFNRAKATQIQMSEINEFYAPEIIDSRFGDGYLIGFHGHKGCRISLGVMTWENDDITITCIDNEQQLKPWDFDHKKAQT